MFLSFNEFLQESTNKVDDQLIQAWTTLNQVNPELAKKVLDSINLPNIDTTSLKSVPNNTKQELILSINKSIESITQNNPTKKTLTYLGA